MWPMQVFSMKVVEEDEEAGFGVPEERCNRG